MITLNERMSNKYDRLLKQVEHMEAALSKKVNPQEPLELQTQIEELRPFLGNMPDMMASASDIYDYAKKECAENIVANESILFLKQNVQKMWIEGELSSFSSLYMRVENLNKCLRESISALISLLSMEKEKIKMSITQEI